jgi:hypothetical protein
LGIVDHPPSLPRRQPIRHQRIGNQLWRYCRAFAKHPPYLLHARSNRFRGDWDSPTQCSTTSRAQASRRSPFPKATIAGTNTSKRANYRP